MRPMVQPDLLRLRASGALFAYCIAQVAAQSLWRKNKEVIGEPANQLTRNPFPLATRGFLKKRISTEKLVMRLLKVLLLLKEF